MPPKQSGARGRGQQAAAGTTTSSREKVSAGRKRTASSSGPATAATGRKNQAVKRTQARKQREDVDYAVSDVEVVDLDEDEDEENMEVDGGDNSEDEEEAEEDDEDNEDLERETIPPDLLTRILYEFFEREDTRITKDANAAVAKYVDVFVREAIARAAAERGRDGSFLEVEELEKIAPQLLMDL
ncbi:hypothetical protein N656DRAFT_799391 [Canariomyces notabilis]|uniref:Centromere protein X n=1 Tax=Canariomyces notabilis TaxID=2074819 RepID=A0AAN6QPL1_9PEZI|nr:hypothetical protein N656DRAFT_799391 [Canariomyces arenarius]